MLWTQRRKRTNRPDVWSLPTLLSEKPVTSPFLKDGTSFRGEEGTFRWKKMGQERGKLFNARLNSNIYEEVSIMKAERERE